MKMLSPTRSLQAAERSVDDVESSAAKRSSAKPSSAKPSSTKPPCVTLVPVTPAIRGRRTLDRQAARADFVTHLIATAEHAPQTRNLRRATPADAQIAYKAQRCQVPSLGIRMRQVI